MPTPRAVTRPGCSCLSRHRQPAPVGIEAAADEGGRLVGAGVPKHQTRLADQGQALRPSRGRAEMDLMAGMLFATWFTVDGCYAIYWHFKDPAALEH